MICAAHCNHWRGYEKSRSHAIPEMNYHQLSLSQNSKVFFVISKIDISPMQRSIWLELSQEVRYWYPKKRQYALERVLDRSCGPNDAHCYYQWLGNGEKLNVQTEVSMSIIYQLLEQCKKWNLRILFYTCPRVHTAHWGRVEMYCRHDSHPMPWQY